MPQSQISGRTGSYWNDLTSNQGLTQHSVDNKTRTSTSQITTSCVFLPCRTNVRISRWYIVLLPASSIKQLSIWMLQPWWALIHPNGPLFHDVDIKIQHRILCHMYSFKILHNTLSLSCCIYHTWEPFPRGERHMISFPAVYFAFW